MGTAVEDVRHGERQERGVAAKVAVERDSFRIRGRVRHRKRHAEDGVGPEPGFVRRAVELDHRIVDRLLIFHVHALEATGDLALDVADRLQDSFASVALGVAVAKLDRLVRASRGAGRDDGPAASRVGECGDRNGRVTARVEHLEGVEPCQARHEFEV